jgi:predicted nucleotide-binding protein
MSTAKVALAKLAGIRKAVESVLNDEHKLRGQRPIQNYLVEQTSMYFTGAADQLAVLRKEIPGLFGDFPNIDTTPRTEMAAQGSDEKWRYGRSQMERLARDIDQIFEIRANSELAPPAADDGARRVFVSHGRAPDWREVQSYIEKDIGIQTLELAQEASLGRTIIAKLWEASEQCDSAVIVMTGDDQSVSGEARARENVIHEIGFFQGKYGPNRICLLHEEGVAIPSNMQGLVYAPFPKGLVSASFGVLTRELGAMYKRR